MNLAAQILRFASVGMVATLIHYGIAFSAILMDMAVVAANALGFTCAFVAGFLGHYHVTFWRGGSGVWRPLIRYCVLSLGSFAAAQVLLWVLVQLLRMPDPIALLGIMVLVAGTNFLLSRYWAFALPQTE